MIRNNRLPRLTAGGFLLVLVILSAPLVRASSITTCPAGGTPLLICATYDSTITGNANAATIESTIDAAIVQIESHFYNPITVNITFDNSANLGGDVGANSTSNYVITYQKFIQALEQDTNEPYIVAALANLPTSATDPVNGNTYMMIHSANAAALGISVGASSPDGTVSLNLGAMNLSRSTTPTSGQYDLETVAMHEIDEVLGLGSTLGQNFQSPYNTFVSPEDLFRYDANGNRTFAAGTAAWFEVTPGTKIAQFNSTAGLDYGDWQNVAGHVRVQDATGTTGSSAQVNLSTAEIEALGVIGYETVPPAPEPSTWILSLAGVAVCGLVRARYTEAK